MGLRITPESLCGMLHNLFSDFDEVRGAAHPILVPLGCFWQTVPVSRALTGDTGPLLCSCSMNEQRVHMACAAIAKRS